MTILAITRRTGETLRFTHEGVEMVLTVMKARGSKVRLGIQAPLSVKIDRPEMDAKRKDKAHGS